MSYSEGYQFCVYATNFQSFDDLYEAMALKREIVEQYFLDNFQSIDPATVDEAGHAVRAMAEILGTLLRLRGVNLPHLECSQTCILALSETVHLLIEGIEAFERPMLAVPFPSNN